MCACTIERNSPDNFSFERSDGSAKQIFRRTHSTHEVSQPLSQYKNTFDVASGVQQKIDLSKDFVFIMLNDFSK